MALPPKPRQHPVSEDGGSRLKSEECLKLSRRVDPLSWTPGTFVFKESTMAKTRPPRNPEFRREMVELVRAGRSGLRSQGSTLRRLQLSWPNLIERT